MQKKTWFWLPRIITIILILFITLFSLDVFGNGLSLFQVILAFIIHSLPSIILALILIIFWKKSRVLGWMWVGFGVLYFLFVVKNLIFNFQFYYFSWILEFSGAAFVMAYLFFRAAKNTSLRAKKSK